MRGLSVLAGCLLAMTAGGGRADDPKENFAVLNEAATDGYYRGRVHSAPVTLSAVARLPEVAKSGRPRQKATAEALIEAIGKKRVADLEAAYAAGKLKADERAARFGVVVGGILETAKDVDRLNKLIFGPQNAPLPDSTADFTGLVADALGMIGASATRAAQARAAASEARNKVRGVWAEKVLTGVRAQKSDELTPAPVALEITQDGRNRTAWTALRNTSGKTLTNVVMALRAKDGMKDLNPQYYFVREWPADEVLWPDPFQIWSVPTGLPDVKPPTGLTAGVALWSEQGRARVEAKPVGFYDHRREFLDMAVRTGARYAYLGDDGEFVLEFTKVTDKGRVKSVEATLSRTGTGPKPVVTRHRGAVDTGPPANPKADFAEVAGLKLWLATVGGPAGAGLVFHWNRPSYLVELSRGKPVRVVPLPDLPPG